MADDQGMGHRRASGKSASGDATVILLGALVAFLLLLVLLWPALVGAVLYGVALRHLRRGELAVLAAAAAVAVVVGGAELRDSYLAWAQSWVDADLASSWVPPLLPTALLAVLLGAGGGLLAGTGAAKRVRRRIAHRIPFLDDDVLKEETLIPDDRTRRKVAASLPEGGMLPSPVRSVDNDVDIRHHPIPLGMTGDLSVFNVTLEELRTHTMVLGSTGSGKSETLKALTAGMADLGAHVTFLDLKEDLGMREFVRDYANSHARPLQELGLTEQQPRFWFNALAGMGIDEARDTILSLQEFDDQHWQNINKRMLGQAVRLLYLAHELEPSKFPAPSMYDLGVRLTSQPLKQGFKDAVAALQRHRPDIDISQDFSSLLKPNDHEQRSAGGFAAKITQMYETEAGMRVLRSGTGRESLDVTRPGLTYIGLDTSGRPDLTKAVSSAVLQRMNVYASQRTTGQVTDSTPRALIIDEAAWIDRDLTLNLLARARGAGIRVILATQGPQDWNDKRGEYWGTMTNNLNIGVVMAQGSQEAAEMCADYLGQYNKLESTVEYRDGRLVDEGKVQRTTDWVVQPHEVRRLAIGEAVVRVSRPEERISWLKVPMRDPAAHPPAPAAAKTRTSKSRALVPRR